MKVLIFGSKGWIGGRLLGAWPDAVGTDARIDDAKARAELGWTNRYTFDDGLRQTVEWYLANRAWWEPLASRSFDPRG